MNFMFAFAGIPLAIYDSVKEARRRICGADSEFLGRPFVQKTADWAYTASDSAHITRLFWERLRADHENKLKDTGFALIYVAHEPESSATLASALFPAIFTAPVRWTFDQSSQMRMNASKNVLVEELSAIVSTIRQALPQIAHEVGPRDNSTPLLLPLKNFASKNLSPVLTDLQTRLLIEQEKRAVVGWAVRRVEHFHPRRKLGEAGRLVFVDDRDIQFDPPGRARHGFAREGNGHLEMCLVAGRRRLGAPYDRSFHYDCTKGNSPLAGQFPSCHEPLRDRKGDPHLNISPNDHIR